MVISMKPYRFAVFPSRLGWMGLVTAGKRDAVIQLTFGHPSAEAARVALDPEWLNEATRVAKNRFPLVSRLQAYASGFPDDFRDVCVEPKVGSRFRRRIWEQCRRIPYGSTMGYAELARRAGYPKSARAVGGSMAANRIPLIVPCHRVVRSDGRIGAFSAPGGQAMKQRLLAMESNDDSP